MVADVKILTLILALPFLLALAAAAHALIDRAVKAILWASSPLATGEPEAFTYERRVYHTADPQMTQIVAIAFGAGALFWLGLATGWGWFHGLGVLALAAAVALDLLHWERVASSANHLWFQRGFGSTVHQILIENIRDVTVQETEVGGFTLRHGTHNRLARLLVRMADKRVVALPKTDAYQGLDDVEGVANHLRLRLQQLADRQALQRSESEATAAAQAAANDPAKADAEIRRELRRLRKDALAPDVPPAVKSR
jgi:hypothetical protein